MNRPVPAVSLETVFREFSMIRWFKYVKPYLPYFIIGPLCMIVEVVGEVVMPRLLARVINNANAGTLTMGMSWEIMFLIILTALVMMAGGVGGAYFGAKASVNFGSDLRADVFSRVQTFSFANIDRFSTASLVTRLTTDVNMAQNVYRMLIHMCIRTPFMMIAGTIMAFRMNSQLAILFLIAVPVIVISVLTISNLAHPRFKRMMKAVDGMNGAIQENLIGIRIVKAYVRGEFEEKKFRKAADEVRRSQSI